MGNCCGGGGGSRGSHHSSESSYYSVHRNPDNYDAGGYTRYGRNAAQNTLTAAPAPTHHRMTGRRPHAHYDSEGHYAAESHALTPIPGMPGQGTRPPPKMWAYSGNPAFDYADQNRHGRPITAGGPDAGPVRIIGDRHQNVVGVSYHPDGDHVNFQRATHHPHRHRT